MCSTLDAEESSTLIFRSANTWLKALSRAWTKPYTSPPKSNQSIVIFKLQHVYVQLVIFVCLLSLGLLSLRLFSLVFVDEPWYHSYSILPKLWFKGSYSRLVNARWNKNNFFYFLKSDIVLLILLMVIQPIKNYHFDSLIHNLNLFNLQEIVL